MNKKKVFIVCLILLIIIGIIIFKLVKKDNSKVEMKDNHNYISPDQTEISNNQAEPINIEPEKVEKYSNVLSSEGVSEGLINDDKAIDFILKYISMINSKDIIDTGINGDSFKNEMKLYMAIEFIINNTDKEGNDVEFTEVPKTIVQLAYKELFGEEKVNFTNAYIYKYDSEKGLYKKESDKVKNAEIVKITRSDEKDGYKEIEYYYTFANNSDCDKSVIRIKGNNQYSFSKYTIIDADNIGAELVGKVSDIK